MPNPLALLAGAALLMLSRKKKPSGAPIAFVAPRAAALEASISADALATQHPSIVPALSLRKQVKMIRNLLRKVVFSEERIRVGAAPYSLDTNYPSPWEMAVLYSVDPEIELVSEAGDRIKVADLLGQSLIEDPNLISVANGFDPKLVASNVPKEKLVRDPATVMANALLLLPDRQLQEFSVDLVRGARPLAMVYGFADSYDRLIADMEDGLRGQHQGYRISSRAAQMGRLAEERFAASGGQQFQRFISGAADSFSWLAGYTKPMVMSLPDSVLTALRTAIKMRGVVANDITTNRLYGQLTQAQRSEFMAAGRGASSANVPALLLEHEKLAKQAEKAEWDAMMRDLRKRI